MTRDEVVQELQRVAAQLGNERVTRREFARHGRFAPSVVERTFGSWNKAITAAGLEPITRYERLSDDELRTEFNRVTSLLGKAPTRSEFAANSTLSPGVYERRFGKWSATVAEYAGTVRPPSSDRHKEETGLAQRPSPNIGVIASRSKASFGPPLNFRELRHEPVNEQGVVFLFGMVARELGFLVDAVRPGFPDCRAKRLTRNHQYVEVDIEFEFRSSNFREHGHDPHGCDLIVCWENDWPGCPVEVLELKSGIKPLDPSDRSRK